MSQAAEFIQCYIKPVCFSLRTIISIMNNVLLGP